MATSKTLTPTNETIQIPAMTDAPDASVFSNCIDKEADAINALNSKITTATEITLTAGSGITVPTGGIKCHRFGRVCYVTLNGLTFSSTGNFIISGLPSPISNVFAKPVSSNSTTTAAIVGNYAYMNTGSTSMAISVASGNTNPHYICFCYITAS